MTSTQLIGLLLFSLPISIMLTAAMREMGVGATLRTLFVTIIATACIVVGVILLVPA